jgi:hypothetical protein
MSWIAWCGLNASNTGASAGLAVVCLYIMPFVQRSCEIVAHVMMMAVESLLPY